MGEYTEVINKRTFYPLADYLYIPDRTKRMRAQWTGEFRQPKKGEWYLSGAIIEAYKAPNDLSTKFHIVRIVETKLVEIEILI